MSETLLIGLRVVSAEGETLRQTSLNFKNPVHRQIIAKTAWWAMHSGHKLTTWPLTDGEEIEEIRR